MDVTHAKENRRVWDAIAESFAKTRTKTWPPVESFLEALPVGTRLLDAGTGNGRHAILGVARGLRVVGLDASRRLLGIARRVEPRVATVQGLLERPPFRPASFQAALAIASVHHVRGRSHRLETWGELRRVLSPGAPLLASAWNRDQPRFGEADLQKPTAGVASDPEPGDAWLRWTQHGLDVLRFIHLYTEDELRQELTQAGFRVERAWLSQIASRDAPDNQFVLAVAGG